MTTTAEFIDRKGIAEALGEHPVRVGSVLDRTPDLKPVGRLGNARIYSRAAIQRVRERLDEMNKRRRRMSNEGASR